MRCGRRVAVVAASLVALVVFATVRSEAHKPITSPYTFNEDIYPILRDKCARCHVSGGVAPMSLMTHQDTVPWSESIRIELIAGHMPPWGVDAPAERFRHPRSLTARELNILLTWASGGTPVGSSERTPAKLDLDRGWRLGTPDVVLPLPEFAMAAEKQEETVEFTIATTTAESRWLRAVDLQPGTPAVVRDARIVVKSAASDSAHDRAMPEQVLAVWVPGDDVVALDGTAFELPARAELVVRMHYKKTWEHERSAMSDRSSVGLYFAARPPHVIRALTLSAPADGLVQPDAGRSLLRERVLDEDLLALAVYPESALSNVTAKIEAVRPDGSREQLISLRAQKDWARRYWFSQPVALPRGTRLNVEATFDAEAQAIAGGAVPSLPDLSAIRFTLNVVSAP